jgi:putative proteasome-type protease
MTYCVGLKLRRGLVMMSDTRTNAGVDNISVFRKMFLWETEGERSITLMTAGNLATTQAVVSLLNERSQTGGRARRALDPRGAVDVPGRESGGRDAARGDQSDQWAMAAPQADSPFSATLILGGQVRGGEPRLFMIYPEGNFVEASRRHALLPDRRDEIRQADPGARL